MSALSKLKQPYLWPLLLLIGANGLIIANAPPALRYIAALVLLTFLPGWVWLQAFFNRPAEQTERLTLAVGLSLALTILGAMFAVYLPGPLTASHLLITTGILTAGGLAVIWRQKRSRSCSPIPRLPDSPTQRYSLLIFAILLILAAALRLPQLGYAEFHEDEAETLMLGVRLLQGEDYAIFLHRKGPAQMLVPVVFWLLTGHISEALARFPFALSSIFSVVTLFFIGRRWFNWQAGAAAGLLWAINGYAIGFGRMVQYQALIFFLGPLAIYCLYLAWKYHQPGLQILAVILLAACLLAHFDALLLLPAAGYLSWLTMSRGTEAHRSRGAGVQVCASAPPLHSGLIRTVLALTLFLVLLASFYIPFLLDPEFNNTVAYLAQSRVKPGLLYNNLNLLQRLDKDYSSHFYLPILALGIISLIIRQSVNLSPKWRWGMAGLGLLLASTVWLPNAWRVGPTSLALFPWFLLSLIYFRLSSKIELRATWVMFGAAFIGYVFLVADPRTHLYIVYPGAALLAGAGWAAVLARRRGQAIGSSNLPTVRPSNLPISIILITGALLVGAIIAYDATIFLQTESALERLQDRWNSSIWETVYDDLPKARSYFGYPKREGWKAVGLLRRQGLFPGDFRSINEDFIIPIWYNFGQARSCYNTPAHFFVRSIGDSIPPVDERYIEVGGVQREGERRLRIFAAEAGPEITPATYALESFAHAFDQLATPQQFAGQAQPAQLVDTQFGSAIKFVGYDLPATTVAPGDILHLDLYWQALENPGANYRAFVHLTGGAGLWGQQDDDPVCRLPTSIWRAGQRGVGQFRLPIDPETPTGRYPLIIGLYRADTLERLKIVAGAGQPGDDFLWLGDIEVVNSATEETGYRD